jgi:two-component system sensor histidine kinase HydH
MSAVLAHEIRNPLASLKGNAQLLSRRLGQGSPESRKAELVVTEAERLEILTTDLLDFVRSGTMNIQFTDPVELVARCVRDVAPDGVVLHTERAPRRWPLDAPRIRQALENLLRNAIQASPAGASPIVSVGREGRNLVLAVQDAGGGIRPGDEERVFAPFFTTKLSGTGLGLAIARRIAEAHAGTIVATNREGGALFRLILPALPITGATMPPF